MTRAPRILGAAFAALMLVAACGGDDGPSESEAVDLLTTQFVNVLGVPEVDARCVSQNIIDEIGVDGLAEVGVATGGSGDIADLSAEQQDELTKLITGAAGECNLAVN